MVGYSGVDGICFRASKVQFDVSVLVGSSLLVWVFVGQAGV